MEDILDDFTQLLAAMRARVERMRSLASSACKDDPHPEFWSYACDLATRWSEALAADDLDWRELARLREESKSEGHRAGIALFTWCTSIESDYLKLREASLAPGFAKANVRQHGHRE